MSKHVPCLKGLLGVVGALSLILLGSCEDSKPTAPAPVKSPAAVATPLPTPWASPTPKGVPGVPAPPRGQPGGGGKPDSGSGEGITIEIFPTSFFPSTATVRVDQQVRWHNSDSVVHTATGEGFSSFDTGPIEPDASSSAVTLSATGTYQYHCDKHPDVTGTLKVIE